MNPDHPQLCAHIAANVRHWRGKRGITQERLANGATIDLTYVQRLERGTVNVTVKVLLQIANALEIPFVALFKERKMPKRPPGRPKEALRRS